MTSIREKLLTCACARTDHPVLNLTPQEKQAYGALFAQADTDQLGVITGENAVTFFERTRVSPNVLGEIWQIADTENRGLLTKPGFCIVLRLIGHYQAGRDPTPELAFKPAPIPRFDGGPPGGAIAAPPLSPNRTGTFPTQPLQPQSSGNAPIRVPPLDPLKIQQFSALFERSSTQNGQIDGITAKAIFERAGLPNEILGRIWNLSDREQKGSLDQTEFIVAMHLLTSMKSRAMTALPTILPQGLYDAAARRGAPPPIRQGTGPAAAIPRQVSGSSVGAIPRTASPLTRSAAFGTPATGPAWLVTPADKAKFDQFFNNLDTQGRGTISGEQAVSFFSDSRLPEDVLAQIWDLADINSEGQLTRDEFAVAMYLIRQQRAPNAGPLPAFLPPALVPPSMRKQKPPPAQSTAPVFDNANNTSNLPKSAADDLFGLDEPAAPQAPALQPQSTGPSVSRDPFGGSQPASPGSPQRFQPAAQQPSSIFKPFMPTSAFGASLASQNTGGSAAAPAQPQASTNDDLLGDNESHAQEASKLTNETTELANMSNQIGNLRNQMEQTQSKKTTTQSELTAASTQKRDLEVRLQQFRAQYEQEVRTVKELEQQLAASREANKKLGQELAMLEGSHQDLQTQHSTVAQALQADQQENADLKARISQLNTEVARLKPEVEKMRLDARQQKGLVSINKKQFATTESERDRLQSEKAELERASAELGARSIDVDAPPPVAAAASASNVTSPAPSLSTTNPFARKISNDAASDRASSPFAPTNAAGAAPTPSAFDALFGPSSAFAPNGQTASGAGTPPATSFIGRSLPPASTTGHEASESVQSASTVGEPTPLGTPPVSESTKEAPATVDPSLPPPPPESRFTASQLPIVNLAHKSHDSETRSTNVVPPASRAGDLGTPRGLASVTPTEPERFLADNSDTLPGAFPIEPPTPEPAHQEPGASVQDDFDSAFASFGEGQKSKEADKDNDDPFAVHSSSSGLVGARGAQSEFPPIQSLELDDEDDDDSSDEEDEAKKPEQPAFEDDFASGAKGSAAVAEPTATAAAHAPLPTAEQLPKLEAQQSPPTYVESHQPSHGGKGYTPDSNQVPPEFDGLLPSREDPTTLATHQPTTTASAVAVHSVSGSATPEPALAPPSRSATNDIFHDASSRPLSSVTDATATDISQARPSNNAFDEFDEFADLTEAKEADGNGQHDLDFGFDRQEVSEFNPAFDSPAASMTNTITSTSAHQHGSSSISTFPGAVSSGNPFGAKNGSGSVQSPPENSQHDWDAIFSGLDSSKPAESSSADDPWGTTDGSGGKTAAAAAPSTSTASQARQAGGAITPGTEHDDPILKRLTGMGYPRQDALAALEKYDYDINMASDYLQMTKYTNG